MDSTGYPSGTSPTALEGQRRPPRTSRRLVPRSPSHNLSRHPFVYPEGSSMSGPLRRRATASAAAGILTGTLFITVPAFSASTLPTIADFEGTLPITSTSPGIFPFGSDAASTPKLAQVAAPDRPGADAGNHAPAV